MKLWWEFWGYQKDISCTVPQKRRLPFITQKPGTKQLCSKPASKQRKQIPFEMVYLAQNSKVDENTKETSFGKVRLTDFQKWAKIASKKSRISNLGVYFHNIFINKPGLKIHQLLPYGQVNVW